MPNLNVTLELHHVLNNVLEIKEDESASLQNWMQYLGYHTFLDLCFDFQPELNDIHSYRAIELKVSYVP